MPDWYWTLVAFAFGSITGSFLNVLIWRLPREESIIHPPSHCTVCGYTLRAWDNIPIFSWLLYKGRCRKCKVPIPVRYLWIEVINGGLWLALYLLFGWSLEFFQYAAIISAMVAVFAIDMEHYIIPDQLWIFMAVVGFIADAVGNIFAIRVFPWTSLQQVPIPFTDFSIPIPYSVAGFLAYGGLVLLIGILGEKVFRKPAMGGGDVKLTAAIGANIGAAYGVISFFLAAAIGAFAGILLMALANKRRMDEVPFGPMLVAGAIVMIFYGPQLVNWWLGYAGFR